MSFQFSKLNHYKRENDIPQTGQLTSYADYDDGYFKKGWKNDSARFTVNGSMVFDKATGLMWAKDLTIGGRKTWANALTYAEGLSLGGYTDWRLPNIKELVSIMDFSIPDIGSGPYSFYVVFTQREAEEYWSSTTNPLAPTLAYEVNGPSVFYHDKADPTPFVSVVRGGV